MVPTVYICCPFRLITGPLTWTSLVVPGETVEETLSREVAEEVGLEVLNVSYSSSQHWPFPHSSFMMGFHASVSPTYTQVSPLAPPTTRCAR